MAADRATRGTADNDQLEVILLLAVIAGLVAGAVRARLAGNIYQPPILRHSWLLLLALLPQVVAFYLPATRELFPTWLAAVCLVGSQAGLLVFVWLNRAYMELWVVGGGLAANLLVIAANGGLMPITPASVAALYPGAVVNDGLLGSRLGWSKDVVLSLESTSLPALRDFILLPQWLPWRYAFSLGDIIIALGAFLLLWRAGSRKAALP